MTLALRWQECPVNTYYTINRILLLCVGLWPCQKSTFKYIAITLMTIILASSVIFQLTTFITRECNTDVFLRVLTYSIPWLGYMLKYNVLCLNAKRMRNLMERMLCDWNELNNVQEIEILKEYADIGRFITLITILFIYGSIFCFILILFLSNFLLDITSSKNESRPRQLPVLIECFIDQQKYFFLILLAACFAVVCSITTVIASETLNMSYTHHACGLFEIASCRIEQALRKNTVQGIASSTERNSILYQGIINGFNMYKRAIEFIKMLKRFHDWTYSLLLPLMVLSLSINLYRFSRLIASKEYSELIISFMYILGHFWYMFLYNYLGQKVIDHSSDVFHRIYDVQWYIAPLKVQKLLLLVMQRSMRHCTLIIGGLFVPSLEGFATLTNTSFSYFAVIFSVF
ncbi:odorant receptor 22c-like [Temnothorax curvispinosus]|uniref:Odorant receptor n=1 Tax=Temnothorax curvispinosus TaxID=300111 RepID=A0A6J1Q9X7_9HYME|nr:odorant receptor 22c-like [Temnothorax curvispinosus]